ncbi:MAG: hypothetical protein IKP28_01100 [Clostridia bacterium]|nr:hypothetical protein [Clostridia bacterium]
MKRMISLLKACMTQNMNLFKVANKKQSQTTKKILPILIALMFLFYIWSYANMLMEPLVQVHQEITLLALFAFFSVMLTIIEGIYKSGSLLFNCKDDNLLLSLPIKKSTVLFVRMFKFYVFELLYNSLLLIPAMLVYIRYVSVDITFYIVSIIALLLLPIIPIIISCIIGGAISYFSTKFKYKNIVQILLTTVLLLAIMYMSFNIQGLMANIAESAESIRNIITVVYYPAGEYVNQVTEFNIINLIIYIAIHLVAFAATIFIFSKIYFKINSKVKVVKPISKDKKYTIKTRKPMMALIKKELNRFTTSPVFVINAGFGLVLFIVICLVIFFKFDGIEDILLEQGIDTSIETIKAYMPVILFGLICFASLMSSITSSMISLEGKSFNILKSLPTKPFNIVLAKVLTSILIMIPFIIVGNLILFVKFEFNIIEILMILLASFVLPLVSETIGILINLKYPKMDAESDTEVVKQSMSTMIAVLLGMMLTGLSIFGLVQCVMYGFSTELTLGLGLMVYAIVCAVLLLYLNKNGEKEFKKIDA